MIVMSVLNILIGSRPNHNTFHEPNHREMKSSVSYRSPGRGFIVMLKSKLCDPLKDSV